MTDQVTEDRALDGARILDNARAIAPLLREEAAGNETNRRLSGRTVEALRSSGVFRMAMPRAWGGPEVDIVTQCEILEELSRADGAAGWCASIGSDSGYYSAGLADDAARRLFPDLDTITAGWVAPGGALHERDGGYLLEGRWQFGSGCTHADVIVAGAVVHRNGQPVIESGVPEVRLAMLQAAEFEILDTWHTTGLAGSGSHDYRTSGSFVPSDQTFRFLDIATGPRDGVLYSWPGLFSLNAAPVPIGIARGAIADAESMLDGKVSPFDGSRVIDDARIQRAVAVAHARVGAARAYWYQEIGAFWSVLEAGETPPVRMRASVAGAGQHAFRACRDAIRDLADVLGTASIRRENTVERRQRDLTTVGQHLFGQDALVETVGAMLLGSDNLQGGRILIGSGVL